MIVIIINIWFSLILKGEKQLMDLRSYYTVSVSLLYFAILRQLFDRFWGCTGNVRIARNILN